MKKLLPVIFSFVISIVLFSFLLTPFTHAQEPTTAPTFGTGLVEGDWYKDQEVTFVGKNAARSGLLLDWTLQNYDWSTLDDSGLNPLIPFWETIRNIVFGLFAFFVLVTAFIFIATRGKSLAARRFIPRFIFVAVMIVLSFAIVEAFYQLTDIMQGFFLKKPGGSVCPPECISQRELLFVGWGYDDFEGLRVYGEKFAESGFITLLLTKLTALTYFVMVGILIVRKIILWFFVIISPIFPVLLLYYPLRNTAKIWVGEFFRWLLYGPLFAVFLAGLVSIWQQYIPMDFKFADAEAGKVLFPTGVNILLGGPGQRVYFESHDVSNNLNLVDTFAQYVVALIMLWIVIILPFILLQIFLDYMSKFALSESNIYKQIMSTASFMNKPPPGSPVPPGTPPIGPAGAGLARSLPFGKKFAIPKGIGESQRVPEAATYQQPVSSQVSSQVTSQIMQLTNLAVPTMRDIARFETSLRSQNVESRQQVTALRDRLQQIATPSSTSTREMRDRLVTESKKGNVLATTILSAANSATQQTTNIVNQTQQILQQIANPMSVSSAFERDKMVQLRETLVKESQSGNQLASTILMTAKSVSVMAQQPTQAQQATQESKKVADAVAKDAKNPVAAAVNKAVTEKAQAQAPTAFPTANRVQSVSLDDYEAVKKMWTENYKTMDVPESVAGQKTDRKQWVEEDINAINETIALLTSQDQEKVKEGMQKVSDILPFLLIGGFSQTEIVAYLKAKQEAAKGVLDELSQQAENEDTLLATQTRHTEAQKKMTASTEAAVPETNTTENVSSNVSSSSMETSVTTPTPVKAPVTKTTNTTNNTTINVYELANLPLPKMHDIARFEASLMSQDQKKKDELAKLKETLQAIASPESGKTPAEKEKYKKLRDALESTSKTGNIQAQALLTAAGVATQKVAPALPTQNRVQSVSLDDYEAVKKLWQENYKTLEAPNQMGRKAWIEEDQKKIDETIALLTSGDQAKIQEGMKRVSEILPFLLIGGFSQTEIVAYLKAKQEAAKSVLQELPDEEQEETVTVISKPAQKPKTQQVTIEQEVPVAAPASQPQKEANTNSMSEMKRLTTYALPSIKDIAHFETRKGEKESDVYKLKQMLTNLTGKQANQEVKTLRDTLQLEEKKGNELAKRILEAAQVSKSSEGTTQTGLEKFLINLTNPLSVSSAPDQKALSELTTKLQDAKAKNDPLAAAVLASATSLNNAQITGIQTVLDKVVHPETATTQTEKDQFKALHTQLTNERQQGNITAAAVLSVAQLFASKALNPDDKRALASLIKEQLVIEKEKGNVFATKVLQEIQRGETREVETQELEQIITKVVHPEQITNAEERQRYEVLKKQMLNEKEQGNTLAATILSLEKGAAPEQAEQEQQSIVKSLMSQMTKQTGKGDALAATLLTELKGRTENKQIIAIDTLLKNLAKPQLLPLASERAYFTELKDKLSYESERSNTLAMSILSASQITEVDGSVPHEARKVYEQLTKEDSVRNLAVSPILSAVDVVLRSERDKEELTTLLEEMSKPEAIQNPVRREIAQTLKAQITAESGKNNQFATMVQQKTKDIASVAPDEKVKIVTAIRESLMQEEEHGNILAITMHTKVREAVYAKELEKLTEILLSIADPNRVQIDEERERFIEIREALLKERDSNPFAAAVLTIAEVLKEKQSLSSTDKATITDLLRQRLLNERAKGNMIADAILNAVSISQPKVDVEKLKEQILEAQKKKDPLAELLMSRLEKKTLPQAVTKLPATNRVQSVSFDDYEAVKKMWIENYQKSDVPQEDSQKTTRKAWIQSDLEKITQTMALLNSQNQNQVQEGLATVAAILPFLLIGGFSQTEVIAYLKAKQEAAKTVLADLPDSDDEQVVTKKKPQSSEKRVQQNAVKEEVPVAEKGGNAAVFNATALPLPTLKDIVRYDLSLLTRDRNKQKEVEKIKDMLASIARPQLIASGEDRSHALVLKDRLMAEQKQGDKTAQAILAASSFVGATVNGTAKASPQAFEKLLTYLAAPQQISDATLRKDMTDLHSQLTAESRSGSQLATTVLNASLTFAHDISSVPDTTRVKDVLATLMNPEHAGDEKKAYEEAKAVLEKEEKKGNVLAKTIHSAMTHLESTAELQKTRDWIIQAQAAHDPVAQVILPLIQSVSHPEIRNISMLLQTAQERHEPIADILTEAVIKLEHPEKQEKKAVEVVLPETNALTKVTPKDLEEVKNLWITSYQTIPVPSNGTPAGTRDEWLKKEQDELTTVTTLLSASEKERIHEGFMKISGILPFFLLGGYTLQELTQYMTQKVEAVEDALHSGKKA